MVFSVEEDIVKRGDGNGGWLEGEVGDGRRDKDEATEVRSASSERRSEMTAPPKYAASLAHRFAPKIVNGEA